MEDNYTLVKTLMDIVNTQMKKASEASVIKCLDLYLKLLKNLKDHPEEAKYKKIKKNSKLVTDAFGLAGGLDLLYSIGWVQRVVEFEEWIVFEGKTSDVEAALTWASEKIEIVKQKSK